MLRENFMMSIENILNNKMRSFLTSLGIIIGVGAVIALITIVQSVTGEMMSQFDSAGAGKVTVMAYGTPLKRGLDNNDIADLESLDNVSGVAPTVSMTGSAGRKGFLVEDIAIQGKSELYFSSSDDVTPLRGRGLSKADMGGNHYVCIADEDLINSLELSGGGVGEKIALNGQMYEIVGVVESSSDDMMSMMSGSSSSDDGTAIIPYKNAMSLSGLSNITNIDIYLSDSTISDQTIDSVEEVLDGAFNHKDDSYSIMNLESLVEMMESMQSMLTSLLAGIASISLVVGGIGIMNMMLVSVTERTREIGLRKALGAEPSQIQVQFIIEAIVLSLIGGIVGIGLGLGISAIAAPLLDTTFSISWGAIILGAGFSLGIGAIFGWAPSRKASALRPIDALRSD